jgi:hypothetical protein
MGTYRKSGIFLRSSAQPSISSYWPYTVNDLSGLTVDGLSGKERTMNVNRMMSDVPMVVYMSMLRAGTVISVESVSGNRANPLKPVVRISQILILR